jgi:hypothetical protein
VLQLRLMDAEGKGVELLRLLLVRAQRPGDAPTPSFGIAGERKLGGR